MQTSDPHAEVNPKASFHVAKRIYGAIQGAAESLVRKEENAPPEWEYRGTVLGLLIDVGSASSSRAFLLITLMVGLKHHHDRVMECEVGSTSGLESFSEVLICKYTKAYYFTFPAVATVVLLLLIGRDFLQKRLYYGLLKVGGVLAFNENQAWKDPLVLFLCGNFLHCVWFMGLHYVAVRRDTHGAGLGLGEEHKASLIQAPTQDLPTSPMVMAGGGSPALSTTPLAMFALMISQYLPIILLIVFFFLAYNIEKSLVPLSEYLNAFEDGASSMPALHTFKDSLAKHLLECSSGPVVGHDTLDAAYEAMIAAYAKEKGRPSQGSLEDMDQPSTSSWVQPRLPSIGLFRALWPADLLLRRNIGGPQARRFQYTWVGFIVIALAWLTYIEVFLLHQLVAHIQRLTEGELPQLLPLTVIAVHIALVAGGMYVFVCSTLALFCGPRSHKHVQ